mgnify:CR=1 FL=1
MEPVSGEYAAGDIVTITAAGAAQGMAFDRWAGNTALDFTENTDSLFSDSCIYHAGR